MAERRPAHKKGHPDCEHPNWAACDKARDAARPRCSALTEKETECSNYSTDEYDGAGYCGVHYGSRVNAALEAKRRSFRKAELDERIERYIAWTAEHPSIQDRMPSEWAPSPAPVLPAAARTPDRVGTRGPGIRIARGRVLWSASSGEPLGVGRR